MIRKAKGRAVAFLPGQQYKCIVSVGESNAGGQGAVSSLGSEADSTSRVKILNTSSGLFENMNLGTNNNLDHFGLDSTYHSWEAGLVAAMDANLITTEPVYYVQCGQGGSRIAQWNNGGSYWNKMQARINQAKTELVALGIYPTWEIWYTQGINDFIDNGATGAEPGPWKDATNVLIAEIRSIIGRGNVRVSSPEFMSSVKTDHPTYITEHEAMTTEIANFRIIDTTGIPTQDAYHWTSAGYITLCAAMAA